MPKPTPTPRRRRSPPCPECGAKRTAAILFGYPSFDARMQQELEDGIIVLGGCVLGDDEKDFVCNCCGYEWGRESPPVTTFPLYILALGAELRVVAPADRRDIGHTEFWESEVASILARRFGINPAQLANLPYCQRRARVAGDKVYYGEEPSPEILAAIRKALCKPQLEFVYDDHEKRLPFDVQEFEAVLASRGKEA
jgi:hypothetical protein